MSDESTIRHQIVSTASMLVERRWTHGSTGNVSARLGDQIVVTPTGSRLDQLAADSLSVVSLDDEHLDGPGPSKETFLHTAMYRARPEGRAVVHLHSTYSVAASCLADQDPDNVLPPLTAYYVMRVGRLPLLPYHAPGDKRLGPIAEAAAASHRALLLANHGPIAIGPDLATATGIVEEIEETARLHLLLHGRPTRPLTDEQVADLHRRFP